MKNRILSLLMALGLVFAFAVNASATELPVEMPDLGEKGSLPVPSTMVSVKPKGKS